MEESRTAVGRPIRHLSLHCRITEKKKLPDTTQKHKDTKAYLEQVLSDFGFETIEKARNVLEDIFDPDAWLKETEQNYRDYLVDFEGTRNNVNTLRQQTKGHEKTDLNALNETILLCLYMWMVVITG